MFLRSLVAVFHVRRRELQFLYKSPGCECDVSAGDSLQ
jgi:hypothetical protein